MTSPQLRILSYIAEATAANGFPPTVREIAKGCELRVTCVQRELDRLEAAGAITRKWGAMRTIRLANTQPQGGSIGVDKA